MTKVLLLTLILVRTAFGQEISAEFSRVGDATHLEFVGQTNWNYSVKRLENKVIVNLPKLHTKAKAHMTAWKDSNISSVRIEPGPDGGDEVTFELGHQSESFDYLTDQPSRLVIDFFKSERPKAAKVEPTKSKAQTKSVAVKSKPKRSPASQVLQLSADKVGTKSPLDAADPEADRFNILDADIKEEAIIASKNNIYLTYPIYRKANSLLKEMADHPPVYEIKPDDTDENKKARLLLSLFKNKRPAVYLKTLEFFEKQYPESKYREIVKYMEADIYYGLYKESGNPLDLEKAVIRYQLLVDGYPESSLAERTNLFIAYSYFERGDYINTLKVLQKFETAFPHSPNKYKVRLTMADIHTLTRHPQDALRVLNGIESDPEAGDYVPAAAFKRGEVYFFNQDYAKAAEEYKGALTKYSAKAPDYPNVHYNLAEALFWLGRYKESLEVHREFITRFPRDEFGGYSITRIGELLEILGADRKKVEGAYLESIFRYQGSEGAKIARIRIVSDRMTNMKEKELKSSMEEVQNYITDTNLPRLKEFVTILMSDGFVRRGEYNTSLNMLLNFYRENPTADLDPFRKRIRENIIQQLRLHVSKGEFLDVFKLYGKHVGLWLKNVDRIDLEFYLARSFEMAGVHEEAANYYRKVLNRLYAIQGTREEKERKVLEDLPSAEAVNLRLAAMTAAMKDFAKANFYLDSIKSTQSLKPVEQVERIELSAIVAGERGQSDKAISFLKDLIENWKGQPALVSGPYLRLAELQMKSKAFAAAALNLEKVLNLDMDSRQVPTPQVIRALELQGDLKAEQKKYREAIQSYRALLDRFEGTHPLEGIRYRLGKLQFEIGDEKEAEKTWSALKVESLWSKMAKEQLDNSKWSQQYKKYLQRIPAMANSK